MWVSLEASRQNPAARCKLFSFSFFFYRTPSVASFNRMWLQLNSLPVYFGYIMINNSGIIFTGVWTAQYAAHYLSSLGDSLSADRREPSRWPRRPIRARCPCSAPMAADFTATRALTACAPCVTRSICRGRTTPESPPWLLSVRTAKSAAVNC